MTEASAAPDLKAALRHEAFARRDALSPEARAAGSVAIFDRVRSIITGYRPTTIALYRPIRSEVDTGPILDWATDQGAEIALPAVVDPTTIVFRRYRPGDALSAGGYGTLAPLPGAPLAEPDLILLPTVAFDRSGARLGHGRGFYDRAIALVSSRGKPPPLIGLAFSVQEVRAIPTEPHDVRLDWIVTENETLDFRDKD